MTTSTAYIAYFLCFLFFISYPLRPFFFYLISNFFTYSILYFAARESSPRLKIFTKNKKDFIFLISIIYHKIFPFSYKRDTIILSRILKEIYLLLKKSIQVKTHCLKSFQNQTPKDNQAPLPKF